MMARKMIDLAGQHFGNWLVLYPMKPAGTHGVRKWMCRCVCGKEREVFTGTLKLHKCRGCGCVSPSPLRPYEALYNQFSYKARRDVQFSYEEFLKFVEQKECHYCGTTITWAKYDTNKNGVAYNLDRKDNALGYTFENCAVCCKRCNAGKSDKFSYEDWVEIGDLIRRQRDRKLLLERRNSVGIRGS
jgi:hypothetical protein